MQKIKIESVLFLFKKQQLTVPRCAAEALGELHATVSLQVLCDMLCHVATDLQGLEVVKV